MAIIKANEEEVKLLARLMRAEAEGDGQLGMLMVGNVGVNRVRARCLDFKNINTVEKMVFQRPGGFGITKVKGNNLLNLSDTDSQELIFFFFQFSGILCTGYKATEINLN